MTTARAAPAEAEVQAEFDVNPPRNTHLAVESIVAMAAVRIEQSDRHRRERACAIRNLLAWLSTFPGSDWQQRWLASGADTQGLDWIPPAQHRYGRKQHASAANALIALEVIRPSMLWLRTATLPHLFVLCRQVMDPDGFTAVNSIVARSPASRTNQMLALNFLSLVRIRRAVALMAISEHDFHHVALEWRATRRRHLPGPRLAWYALREAGGMPGSPADYRAVSREGQLSIAELVHRRDVKSDEVRALLIDYISERATSVDNTTTVGLVRLLVKNFWVDTEKHHPEQTTLYLTPAIAAAWKQRLRYLPGGRERADYFTHLMTVRSFYLDIAEWALSDPARWAKWVSPPPVSAGETAGAKKQTRRTQARMHQRTRTLAPVLPQLVSSVNTHREWATSMLAAARTVWVGDTFEIAGVTYRRVVIKTAYGDGSRPSVQALGNGRVLRLHRVEEVAFWAWAVVEVLRLTGIRLEELLELTHLSIRRYVAPTGELTPLLQIAPSKADRERVLPAVPELVSVLAEIIRRCRADAETLPLLSRYDPLERTWGARLPHLFQPNFGGAPRVLTPATVRNLLIEATERMQVTDVDGSPLRFTPHDMRRIFASDVVNSGLPIHIAQQLLGHLDLNTTQGSARGGLPDRDHPALPQLHRPPAQHASQRGVPRADHRRVDRISRTFQPAPRRARHLPPSLRHPVRP